MCLFKKFKFENIAMFNKKFLLSIVVLIGIFQFSNDVKGMKPPITRSKSNSCNNVKIEANYFFNLKADDEYYKGLLSKLLKNKKTINGKTILEDSPPKSKRLEIVCKQTLPSNTSIKQEIQLDFAGFFENKNLNDLRCYHRDDLPGEDDGSFQIPNLQPVFAAIKREVDAMICITPQLGGFRFFPANSEKCNVIDQIIQCGQQNDLVDEENKEIGDELKKNQKIVLVVNFYMFLKYSNQERTITNLEHLLKTIYKRFGRNLTIDLIVQLYCGDSFDPNQSFLKQKYKEFSSMMKYLSKKLNNSKSLRICIMDDIRSNKQTEILKNLIENIKKFKNIITFELTFYQTINDFYRNLITYILEVLIDEFEYLTKAQITCRYNENDIIEQISDNKMLCSLASILNQKMSIRRNMIAQLRAIKKHKLPFRREIPCQEVPELINIPLTDGK
jgi:hypothetical protein